MGGYPPPVLPEEGPVMTLMRKEPYRFRVKEGDFVRLPDGRIGTVCLIQFDCGGGSKAVSVRPDRPKRRWLGLLPPIPVRLANEEIDRPSLIAAQEQLDDLSPD